MISADFQGRYDRGYELMNSKKAVYLYYTVQLNE